MGYVVGYHLNRLNEPVFIAVSKPLLTEFGIHRRLESCGQFHSFYVLQLDLAEKLADLSFVC